MEIMMLSPSVKTALWGGRKLIDDFGFETDYDIASEAWLTSCHDDGPSIVLNGKYKGRTLKEAVDAEGKQILGTHNADRPVFPVLIKIIDACDKLSVQVHPGDEYAWAHENENGKTEAWYVIDAQPGAELIYGVDGSLSKEEFENSIRDNTLSQKLLHVAVKPGDVVFIPSGMIHAIGAGILIAEVQQSSNTTYRIYDYDRVGKDGKKRELHIKQACDVSVLEGEGADFSPAGKPEKKEDAVITYLTGCDFFRMTSVKLDGGCTFSTDETTFKALLVLKGNGKLFAGGEVFSLKKGSSVFVPANFGKYRIEGAGLELLETET